MQPIALMAAHGQAGSRGKQTPTPRQTLNNTTKWIHTMRGGGMGHTWTKRGMGRTIMHVMRGADANTLLAGRLNVEMSRCASHLFSNHMRPPACVNLKRA